MKKKSISFLLSFALILSLFCLPISAADANDYPTLEISGTPKRCEYTICNDVFNPGNETVVQNINCSGLTATITYPDGKKTLLYGNFYGLYAQGTESGYYVGPVTEKKDNNEYVTYFKLYKNNIGYGENYTPFTASKTFTPTYVSFENIQIDNTYTRTVYNTSAESVKNDLSSINYGPKITATINGVKTTLTTASFYDGWGNYGYHTDGWTIATTQPMLGLDGKIVTGNYTIPAYFLGVSGSYTAKIQGSPIKKVSITHGFNNNEFIEGTSLNNPSGFQAEVTLEKDFAAEKGLNEVVELAFWQPLYSNEQGVYVDNSLRLSQDISTLSVGTHNVKANVMGVESENTVPVEIIKTPVKNVKILDVAEGTNIISGTYDNVYKYNIKLQVTFDKTYAEEKGIKEVMTFWTQNSSLLYLNGMQISYSNELQNAAVGDYNVSVSVGNVQSENTFKARVIESPVESVTITKAPSKTEYLVNSTTPTLNGIEYKIQYKDGTSETVSRTYHNGYSVTLPDDFFMDLSNMTEGSHESHIKYLGVTSSNTFKYKYVSSPVDHIEIASLPKRLVYISGTDENYVDCSGLKVNLIASDGSVLTTLDYSAQKTSYMDQWLQIYGSYNPNLIGQQNINVSWHGKSTSFPITVVENEIASIEVVKDPTVTTYEKGFLPTFFGTKIKITKTDGTTSEETLSKDNLSKSLDAYPEKSYVFNNKMILRIYDPLDYSEDIDDYVFEYCGKTCTYSKSKFTYNDVIDSIDITNYAVENSDPMSAMSNLGTFNAKLNYKNGTTYSLSINNPLRILGGGDGDYQGGDGDEDSVPTDLDNWCSSEQSGVYLTNKGFLVYTETDNAHFNATKGVIPKYDIYYANAYESTVEKIVMRLLGKTYQFDTKTESIVTPSVKVKGVVKGDSVSVVGLNEEDLNTVKSDAAKNNDALVLDVAAAGSGNDKVNAATIGSGDFSNIKSVVDDDTNSLDYATLTFSDTSVKLDKNSIANICEQSGSEITISCKSVPVSAIDSTKKEAIDSLDNPVVIEANLVSDGTAIHELGGNATLIIAFELPQGADPENLKGYYVDDNGQKHEVNLIYDPDTKTVSIDTTHFSTFVIAMDRVPQSGPGTKPQTNGNNSAASDKNTPDEDTANNSSEVIANTNDPTSIFGAIAMITATAGLSVITAKKRKENK